MRKAGLTYEHVAEAAESLLQEGKPVTIRSVREAVRVGSPNTIHRFLGEWRASRSQEFQAPAVSEGFLREIGRELERVASRARTESQSQLEQALEEAAELAKAGSELEQERDALLDRIGQLTTERDQAIAVAAERASKLEHQARNAQREQVALETLRVELSTTAQRLKDLSARLEEERQKSEAMAKLLRETESAGHSARQESAVLAAQLEAERASRTAAHAREAALEARVADLSRELAASQAREHAALVVLEQRESELAAVREELGRISREAAETRGVLAERARRKDKKRREKT